MTDRRSRARHAVGVVGALACAVWAVVWVTAVPAGAHNVGGGKYVSQVTDLSPTTPVVTASIGGGDELLALTVQPGHEVVVLGYGGEPYLRFDPDGTVYENHLSPARYLNEDRFATTVPPAEATAEAATAKPDWQRLGTGGAWVWHDHRIHWMSQQAPPAIKGKESETVQLFDWKVPITVDGAAVSVDGLLQYTPTGGGSAWVETGITVGLPLLVIAGLGWWSVRSAKRRAARVAETP
jgi:hypothetical protein